MSNWRRNNAIRFPNDVAIWDSLTTESGVYMLYNYKKKLRYIGFSFGKYGIRGRVKCHIDYLRLNKHPNEIMQSDWIEDNTGWVASVLEITKDKLREEYWTRFYQSYLPNYGYNIDIGSKRGELSKQRISNNSHRKYYGPFVQTSESNMKRSKALLGIQRSAETKKKMSKPKDPLSVKKRVLTRRIKYIEKLLQNPLLPNRTQLLQELDQIKQERNLLEINKGKGGDEQTINNFGGK